MKLTKLISGILLEYKMEDYLHILNSYAKDYIIAKDPAKYSQGQKIESNLKKIYDSLTPDAKFQCALSFKKVYTAKYGNALNNWDPSNEYDLKKFDGYTVHGFTDKI